MSNTTCPEHGPRGFTRSDSPGCQATLGDAMHRSTPIDMVLHCPACGLQHIDKPEPDLGPSIDGSGDMPLWTNPPHRSHLCHGCGHVWRPADVPTNGVQAVRTRGKDDSDITVVEAARAVDATNKALADHYLQTR